ncbi:MAG: hypothetical protein ABJH45_15390 [Paracoccaceae bacterium]
MSRCSFPEADINWSSIFPSTPAVVIEPAPVLPSLVRDDGGTGEVILMKLDEVNSILGASAHH